MRRKPDSTAKWGAGCLIAVIVIAITSLFWVPLLGKALWNYIGPSLFHAPAVTYWQAFVIYVLLLIVAALFSRGTSS